MNRSMSNVKFYIYKGTALLAEKEGSLYRDVSRCRDDVIDFFVANEWFGQKPSGDGDAIYLLENEELTKRLRLWLKAYGRSDLEKMDILIEEFSDDYPDTCKYFKEYLVRKGKYGSEGALRIFDFLLYEINKEVTEYTEDEIQSMIKTSSEYLAISNCEMMIDFLKSLKGKGKLSVKWEYEMHSRRVVDRENTAYPLRDFSFMAYVLFNEEAWKDKGLVSKALEKRKYADMWLYISLHFVCALRRTDIIRLPAPELPAERSVMVSMIESGEFSGRKAASFTEHWVYLSELVMGKPNKTRRYSSVPDVKFYVPESLKEPMGIILALALIHHEKGDACVRDKAEINDIRDFFGDDFADISGTRRFMTRRANKAYIQGIEGVTGGEPGSAKGYMLAALARSHKGGIGRLSDITEIYLKDVAFTGYTPDFILMEMYERGIFGFIPALLLNRYYGDDYKRLGVTAQTKLIKMIGLNPIQLEGIVTSVDRSMDRAEKTVHEILTLVNGTKEDVARILQTMCSGDVPAKQDKMLCLCLSAGLPCKESDRSCCIGCGYEIYTKSAFHILMQEYVTLSQKRGMAEGIEKIRCSKMMSEGILPAVSQILVSMEMLYPETDMEPMIEMMERGIGYATACE